MNIVFIDKWLRFGGGDNFCDNYFFILWNMLCYFVFEGFFMIVWFDVDVDKLRWF